MESIFVFYGKTVICYRLFLNVHDCFEKMLDNCERLCYI